DGVRRAAVLRSPFFAIDDATLARLAWPAGAARPALTRRFGSDESFADLGDAGPRLVAIRDLLRRLRALRSRATIAELITDALAATDFEAVCLTQFQGAQKVANVRKLIELARDAERRRFFTLRDFVALVEDLGERQPREPEAQLVGEQDDVVRMMTIHQAKGLEFPVVVLVDLGRRLERDNDTAVIDEELGVLVGRVRGSAGEGAARRAGARRGTRDGRGAGARGAGPRFQTARPGGGGDEPDRAGRLPPLPPAVLVSPRDRAPGAGYGRDPRDAPR